MASARSVQRCYRLFQERPATAFELAGLAVPADPAYRISKVPQLTRAEIQIMLHLPETDLKKTRFYQEAYEEGKEIGESEGERRGEVAMVLRQLKRRFGELTEDQQGQIEHLSAADLGALGEALLDFTGAEDLDGWLRRHRGG